MCWEDIKIGKATRVQPWFPQIAAVTTPLLITGPRPDRIGVSLTDTQQNAALGGNGVQLAARLGDGLVGIARINSTFPWWFGSVKDYGELLFQGLYLINDTGAGANITLVEYILDSEIEEFAK